ncbi:hypothetical protein BRC71_02575 [Halobacteriales archaeon QH_7_65_31]|nr:MAG: hypothetical protein BRC71_02575 [Halobacteriales archaeon QH_7_65_31]
MSNRSTSQTPSGWPTWLDTYDHIGSHYPYYNTESPDEFFLNIGNAIETIPPEERELDLAGVLEVLFRRWPLGNRTLVTGLRRSPWMAEPNENDWIFHEIPNHGDRSLPEGEVASKLVTRLRHEAKSYTKRYGSVGLLLSGGLDSRIVAGIVRQLQLEDEIDDVTAFTWGVDDCRDVYYAREITDKFNWDFKHFPLNAELLKENIKHAGELGAEFSPLHLHALPEIRDQANVDVMLAGSYGNSIGRAEYSGNHVTDLYKMVPHRLNKFGVLRNGIVSTYRETVLGDAYKYRTRISRSESYQFREIEQQLHYMRRLLQPCMTHIAERVPLYQLFTAPDVVELMLGLDPETRGKPHCTAVLKKLPGDLEQLPNAKTGIPPARNEPVNDSLRKEHHEYARWLRNDLTDDVIRHIRSGPLYRVFNESALERLFQVWPRANTQSTNAIDELLTWLASLSIFLQTYNISVPLIERDVIDLANRVIGPPSAQLYQIVRGVVRE